MQKTISIDLETYSEVDLTRCSVYAYTASPSFEILLFAYAYEDEEVQVVDLARGEEIPKQVLEDLEDKNVIKTAFNAQFERTCLARYLGKPFDPASWQCTAVQSASLGLPLSLEGVAEVLGLGQQKLQEGKALIRTFSVPCQDNPVNKGRTRLSAAHAPEKWERFKVYCKRDVEVERAIRSKIKDFPISANEQRVYALDQEINDRGVQVDQLLVREAIECDRLFKKDLLQRLKE